MRLVASAVLLGALGLAACQASDDAPAREKPAAVRGRLTGGLSAPIDLETFVNTPLRNSSAPSQDLACLGDSCLLLYVQSLPSESASYLYGTRLSTAGALLDAPRISLGPAVSVGSVVIGQNDYVATWTVPVSGGSQVRAARLSAATGQIASDVTSSLPTGTNHRLYRGETTLLDLYDQGGTTYFQLLAPDTLLPVGTSHALTSRPATVAAGGGQFLFAWSEVFQRVTESTGAFLDAAPVIYTHFYPGTPHAAFAGGVFQLVWDNQTVFYGSRIRASDGALLDADTATVAGSKKLCTSCYNSLICPGLTPPSLDVTALGSDFVVSWRTNTSTSGICDYRGLGGLKISSATGEVVVQTTTSNAAAAPPPVKLMRATGAGTLLMVDAARVTPIQVPSSAGSFFFSLGTAAPYPLELQGRGAVALTAGAAGFLSLWVQNDGAVVASRLGATPGPALDSTRLAIGTTPNYTLAASSDTAGYFVAWAGNLGTINRRFVASDGTLGLVLPTPLPRPTTSVGVTASIESLSLARGGAGFLLGYGARLSTGDQRAELLRLSTTGNAADTSPVSTLTVYTCSGCQSPSASAGLDPRGVSPAAYLLLSWAGTKLAFSSVPATAGSAPTTGEFSAASRPVFAVGATNAVAFYSSGGGRPYVVGQIFDLAAPAAVPANQVKMDLCDTCSVRAAWFDGTAYIAAIEDSGSRRLFLRAYGSDLAPAADAGPLEQTVTDTVSPGWALAGASDRNGTSVVLYQESNVAESGVTLRARWFQRTPSSGTGGTGGSGGGGGSSGGTGGRGPGGSGGSAGGLAGSAGGRGGVNGGLGGGGRTGNGGNQTGGVSGPGGSSAGGRTGGAQGGNAGAGTGASTGGQSAGGGPGSGGAQGPGGKGGNTSATTGGKGGNAGSPGQQGTGGSATAGSSSGCGCEVGEARTDLQVTSTFLLGLAFMGSRRRRRS